MDEEPGRPVKLIPPVYFLAAVLVMIALHYYWPLAYWLADPYTYIGAVPILAGLWLAGSGAYYFRKLKTPIRPFERPTALVVEGPFKYTRNPMYLGLVLILLGTGIWLGSATPFLAIPPFIWLLRERFIKVEERSLERLFGARYRDYKGRVRRWL